jgi:2-iminobutanoate/2-iminopropanoate deaminase
MAKNAVVTASAPKAIGPYSQAIESRGSRWIYCSGQIPLDPQTGQMLGGGDVAQEARCVLQNLAAVLSAAGATLEQVVKTTVYLTDMTKFPVVNQVYATFFADTPPARTTVQVAALPKGAQVEIDAVAVVD